jgi:hypothetical protein
VPENPFTVQVDQGPLEALVRRLVAEAVQELDSHRDRLDGKLAFSEAEAARLLSLNPHQLRDERRRGRISSSEIVGRRIRYTRDDLVNYLMQHRHRGSVN